MKLRIMVIFAMSLVVLVASTTAGLAQKKHYVNGIDANYPPFAFVNQKGKANGFDIEAMDWIAAKMGFTVEHRPMDWDGIVPSLLAKKIDMVCSGMSISPERKARVTFSTPYWEVRKLLLVMDTSSLTKDELLTGNKTLGVQGGTNEAELLKQSVGKNGWNYTLKFYDAPLLVVDDLVNGRIDGAAIDSAPAEVAMKKGKKPIKIIGEFAEPDEFGVAVRNEEKELLDLINKGYELLKQDPKWDELKAKYFPVK